MNNGIRVGDIVGMPAGGELIVPPRDAAPNDPRVEPAGRGKPKSAGVERGGSWGVGRDSRDGESSPD